MLFLNSVIVQSGEIEGRNDIMNYHTYLKLKIYIIIIINSLT